MSNVSDCPVCFESMATSAMSLSHCAHHICEDCSQALEKEPRKIECPFCRTISKRVNRDYEYQKLLQIIEKPTLIKSSTLKWEDTQIEVFLNGNRAKEAENFTKIYERCICCGTHETSHEEWKGQYCCKEKKCLETFAEIFSLLPANLFYHEKANPINEFIAVEFPEIVNIEPIEPSATPEAKISDLEIQASQSESYWYSFIFNWFWWFFEQR